MTFLAYVKSKKGRPGYILVEATDKSKVEDKIRKFYKEKWPEDIIEKIQVGETIP